MQCPGCGVPRDEAWVWSADEQAAKYERARAMADTRLCVYCRAGHVVMESKREGGREAHGHYVTFEPPRGG
ncbi:MAG: hypothetical protein ACOCUN_00170 [Jiangellaceae bacterium]